MNIAIRLAKKQDMREVAEVHEACFEGYFSTKLGKKILEKYYGAYLEKFPELFVVACDTDKNKIIGLTNGYVVGTNVTNEFVKKNIIIMALRVMWLLIKFDKVAWKKVFGMIKKEKPSKEAPKVKDGSGDLLSICVIDEYKGCGAAQHMIEKFEEELKKLKIEEYFLSVFSDNARARKFYEKCGFGIYFETEKEIKYIKKLK